MRTLGRSAGVQPFQCHANAPLASDKGFILDLLRALRILVWEDVSNKFLSVDQAVLVVIHEMKQLGSCLHCDANSHLTDQLNEFTQLQLTICILIRKIKELFHVREGVAKFCQGISEPCLQKHFCAFLPGYIELMADDAYWQRKEQNTYEGQG